MFDDILAKRSNPQTQSIMTTKHVPQKTEATAGMFADILAKREETEVPQEAAPQEIIPQNIVPKETVSQGMFGDILARRGEYKIGFGEAFIQDPLEKVPFSPVGALKFVELLSAIDRLTKDTYTPETLPPVMYGMAYGPAKVPHTPETQKQADISMVTDFFEEMGERERRGYTIGGRVGQIISGMPAFAIEFLVTGGIARLGSKAAQKAGEKILKQYAKKGLGKAVVGISKFVVGAGARALAMPHRGVESILKRRLPKDISFDDLDNIHITKPDEKAWTSVWKGTLDHYIEIASEQAGEYLGPAVSKVVGKLPLIGKFTEALQNAWLGKHPTKKAADFLKAVGTKTGFHGVLTEIGEEDIGWISRAILDIEDFGAGSNASIGDRLKAGLTEDIANLPAELIAFSIPGIPRAAIAHSFKSPIDMYNVVSVDADTGKVTGVLGNFNDPVSAYRFAREMTTPADRYEGVEFEIREPGEAPETSRFGRSRESAEAFYETAVKERKARQLRELETGEVEPLRNYILREYDKKGALIYQDSFETKEALELAKQGAEQEGSTVETEELVSEFIPEIQPEDTPPSEVPTFIETAEGDIGYDPGEPAGLEITETAEERENLYSTLEDINNIKKRGISKKRVEALSETLSKKLSQENPDLNLSRGWFRDMLKTGKKGIKKYHHSMSRVYQVLKHLDGGYDGTLVSAIYRPIKTAAWKSHLAREKVGRDVQKWLSHNKIPWIKMLRANETVTQDGKTYKISSFQKIQVYLNTLNEDNLRHLQNTLSQENIDKLSKLNKTEQKVADWLLEKYSEGYAETADIYSKATGKELGLVDNYVHIDVDKEFIDFRNDIEEEQVTRRTFKPRDVEKGATRKRVKNNAPLNLKDALSAFVLYEQNRTHYVNMELNAKDVKDIINNPKLAQKLNQTTGVDYRKLLNKWLTDTATQSNQEINNWFNNFMNGMRRNYITYALGFNLVTMMRQPVSFCLAVAKDPLILANLCKEISFKEDTPTLYPDEKIEAEPVPFGESRMLSARFMERELREMELLKSPVKALAKKLKVRELPQAFLTHPVETWKGLDIRELSFRHIRLADRTTVGIIFKAAYRSGRQRGMDIDGAIAYADSIIETTQPMAGMEDLPDIYRGGTFAKVFTAFQNQINQNYNFWAYDVIGAKREKRIDNTELAWRVFMGHIFPAFLMGSISQGKLPWDEEFLKDWKTRLADQAGYLVVPLYFFGTVVRNMIEGFGGRQTLPLQVIDDIDDVAKGKTWIRKLKGTARAIGKGAGLPLNQFIRFAEGVYDWSEGKHEDYKRLIWSKYMLEKKFKPPITFPKEPGTGELRRRTKRPSGRRRRTSGRSRR